MDAGILMTPPSSPPSNPAALTRSNSHSSSAVPVNSSMQHVSHHQSHHAAQPHMQQQPHLFQSSLLPTVPSSTAEAIIKAGQMVHSWQPEEAGRLAEHAWQDGLLSPAGLPAQNSPEKDASSATTSSPSSNVWDFVDPTIKSNCICAK